MTLCIGRAPGTREGCAKQIFVKERSVPIFGAQIYDRIFYRERFSNQKCCLAVLLSTPSDALQLRRPFPTGSPELASSPRTQCRQAHQRLKLGWSAPLPQCLVREWGSENRGSRGVGSG